VVITTEEETNRGVEWRLVTPDGVGGEVTIGGEKFDLAKGNVFLVSTDGVVKVTQLSRDLSALPVKPDSFVGLAKEDEAIRKFVAGAVPSK
jgi:hypothetical protein